MDQALTEFIREALGQCIAKPRIEAEQLEAGWLEDEHGAGLACFQFEMRGEPSQGSVGSIKRRSHD